jgi:hypothetical protein
MTHPGAGGLRACLQGCPRTASLAVVFLVAVHGSGRSQCLLQWSSPSAELPGVNGTVSVAAAWDPDGPGPAGEVPVIGGSFSIAGSSLASGLARFDQATNSWVALGPGFSGIVNAIATLPNGDLVVGGYFSFAVAGGQVANNVARWNGVTWSRLAAGTDGGVQALAVLPNGDLVAGGGFFLAGGVAVGRIARWDGAAWSTLGTGMPGVTDEVRALAVLANGDLVAGGRFATAGGVAAEYIARWDGVTWYPVGLGPNNYVNGLVAMPNGGLIAIGPFGWVGGVFPSGAPANQIARWDGVAWTGFGTGPTGGGISCVVRAANGDVIVGGAFTSISGVAANRVARWNGVAWSAMGSGCNGTVSALAPMAGGDVIAGGWFTSVGGIGAARVARWSGGWAPLGTGMVGYAAAVVALPNGDLVAAGTFSYSAGTAYQNISRWDGIVWHPLGTGITGFNSQLSALAVMPNGDLVAGGHFSSAGGQAINHIARWNGSSWSSLGSGVTTPGYITSLLALPSGHLIAGGSFTTIGGVAANRVARWNGVTWSALGTGMNNGVDALALLPNGDIVAGGRFTTAGGGFANYVARWNGTAWSALGSGLATATPESVPAVAALAALPNGDVVVAGSFDLAGGQLAANIARWDGATWHPYAGGVPQVHSLAIAPDGGPIAGCWLDTRRWDGAGWVVLGGTYTSSLSWHPSGSLVAGGWPFPRILTTNCPATAQAYGVGCSGPGGLNSLDAVSLPWLGSPFVVRATGLVSNSYVLGVRGFEPTMIPLVNIVPHALPGCSLLATPDLIELQSPASSVATFTTSVPLQAALVGASLRLQAIAVEFDAAGALIATTSSNAIRAKFGVY